MESDIKDVVLNKGWWRDTSYSKEKKNLPEFNSIWELNDEEMGELNGLVFD